MFKNFGKKEEPVVEKKVQTPKAKAAVAAKTTAPAKPAPKAKAEPKTPTKAKAAPAEATQSTKPSGRPGKPVSELKTQIEQYENEIAVLTAKADKKGSDLPAINEQISILNKKRRRLVRRLKRQTE